MAMRLSGKRLLQCDADVNSRNSFGFTPLNAAAYNGDALIEELLLQYDADVNTRENKGWSRLHVAAFKGYADVVKVLLKNYENINTSSNDDWSLLNLIVFIIRVGEIPQHFWGSIRHEDCS